MEKAHLLALPGYIQPVAEIHYRVVDCYGFVHLDTNRLTSEDSGRIFIKFRFRPRITSQFGSRVSRVLADEAVRCIIDVSVSIWDGPILETAAISAERRTSDAKHQEMDRLPANL
jgi:hypothetical protein